MGGRGGWTSGGGGGEGGGGDVTQWQKLTIKQKIKAKCLIHSITTFPLHKIHSAVFLVYYTSDNM